MSREKFIIPEAEIRTQAKEDGITHFAVGIALLKEQKVLIVRRVPADFMGGNYELPGGGVEKGESFEQAIKRETLEETGLQVIAILKMFEGFDYEMGSKKVRQINFLIESNSYDVKLAPNEHDDFTWINQSDLEKFFMSSAMRETIQNFLLGNQK